MLTLSIAALLAAGSTPEVVQAAAPAPKKVARICRTIDNSTSRIKTTRVCLTKEEWDELWHYERKEWEDRGSTGR